jgi:hypothetical protein
MKGTPVNAPKRDTLKAASYNALWFLGPLNKRVKLSQALATGTADDVRFAAQASLPGVTCPKARKRLELALRSSSV